MQICVRATNSHYSCFVQRALQINCSFAETETAAQAHIHKFLLQNFISPSLMFHKFGLTALCFPFCYFSRFRKIRTQNYGGSQHRLNHVTWLASFQFTCITQFLFLGSGERKINPEIERIILLSLLAFTSTKNFIDSLLI